jgi:hypothetical protein
VRSVVLALSLIAAAAALAACGLSTKPADPYALLPPGDRPPPGPGLFTGEDGVYRVLAD